MMRRHLAACALLFLALFAVYLRTLNPAFRADDSPETIASCVTLGIQHPPGYPLHTLVGRLASLPNLATPAWRLNAFAAFSGALTAALLAAVAMLWSGSWAAGLLSGILLGLSPTFWSQSLAAKGGIYTFHDSLLAFLILALTLWERDMAPRLLRPQSSRLRLLQSRYFLLSALALFLGFGNHWETQALFLPALLAWLFFFLSPASVDKNLPQGKGLYRPLVKAGLLALAALSVYLYLPLRAAKHPAMNWGVPDTWKQFWWVVLRQEYLDLEVGFLKALKAALTGHGNWAEVAETFQFVKRQGMRVASHLLMPGDLGLLGSSLALAGAVSLTRLRRWRELALTLGMIASFCFVVTFYFHLKPEMIWILDVFLIPAYMMQALLAGMGAAWICCLIPARLQPGKGVLLALLFGTLAALRGPALSQHDHFWAWDYGHNFLMSLKKNAIVLAEGDFNTMPIYYLQQVKHERPDVAHVTTIFASTEWGVREMERTRPELGISVQPKVDPNLRVGDGALLKSVLSEIIAKNQGSRPIFASLFRQVQSENLPELEPFFKPSGLAAEYRGADTPEAWRRRKGLALAMVLRYLPEDRSRFEPSPEFALSNYGTLYMDLANQLRAHNDPLGMALYPRAVSLATVPNRAEAWTHWGIALASSGKLEDALQKFEEALKVKPLFEANANMAGVLNQLKRYEAAESFARQAIAQQPSSGQSWNNLAISLYYRGRQSEAVQALETAARMNPQDPTISANLRALKGNR